MTRTTTNSMKLLVGEQSERVNGKVTKSLKTAIVEYREKNNKMSESEFLRIASVSLLESENKSA